MNNKKVLLIAGIFVAFIQLYFPASMITEHELTLKKGKEFRFKTAPVDPYDYFRGKYITLNYPSFRVPVVNMEELKDGQEVYAILKKDSAGFAAITAISLKKPGDNTDFVKAQIYLPYNEEKYVNVYIPFTRFYTEELKAVEAERLYNLSAEDSTLLTYAVVMVRNGNGVVKDVRVNEALLVE